MNGYVKTSPHLFAPVARALRTCVLTLAALAVVLPAPLDPAADAAHPPNPVRSAWFLLWIQELVSYSTLAIAVVVVLAVLLVALPWLPLPRVERAEWFGRPHRPVAVAAVLVAAAVAGLTLVATFCRGANWSFVWPF